MKYLYSQLIYRDSEATLVEVFGMGDVSDEQLAHEVEDGIAQYTALSDVPNTIPIPSGFLVFTRI